MIEFDNNHLLTPPLSVQRRNDADNKPNALLALLSPFPFTAPAAQDRKRPPGGAVFGGNRGLDYSKQDSKLNFKVEVLIYLSELCLVLYSCTPEPNV